MDAETHNIPSREQKKKVGIRWLGGGGLHTSRSYALILLGVVFIVSSHLYGFVTDLIACRLVNLRLSSGLLVWLL